MTGQVAPQRSFAKAHWFYLLLPLTLLAAWLLSTTAEAARDPLTLERTLLFDFGLFLPAVYALYLRGRLRPAAIALRCVGLGLAGLWFAGWLMPQGEGEVLPFLGWLRMVVFPILIVFELVAFAAILRIVYSPRPDPARLLAAGMPPLLVRALLAEARFWRWVWHKLRGRG